MRALKILVGVMAVMILAGVALLVVAIADRLSHGGPAHRSAAPFAAAPIALPAGARIEAMSTGANRLVVDVVLADGRRELLVIDLATGARLGTIPLQSGP